MNFDVNKMAEFFKKEDIAQYKNEKGNVNNVEDTLLFEQEDGEWKLDENLKTKEGFVNALFSDKEKALTKDQLGTIYDAISNMDGKEGMSEEELEQLASFGNAKDKFDSEGNTINEFDIAAFLDVVDEAIDDPNCCDTDCCPEDCSCNDDPPEGIETILKDDDRIKTEGGEVAVDPKDLPEGWSQNDKGEILDKDGNVIGRVETTEADVLNNDGINEIVQSFYLFEEGEGRKYVEVEPWSPELGENSTLTNIIENCYDLEAMGIEPGSEEYKALEKAVMDANPEIYGTEDGGWREEDDGKSRDATIINPGDKIYLPEFKLDAECPCDHDPEPTVATTPDEPTVPTKPTVPTEPTTPTVDTTPTEPTVDTTPTEPTVDTTPTEPTVDTTPTEPTVDTTPTEPTVDTTPTEPTVDTTPTEPTVDTTPDEPTCDTTPPFPDEPTEEEVPTLPTVDTTPDEPTIDTTPDTPTVDTTPDEPTVDTTPDTPTVDTTPEVTPPDVDEPDLGSDIDPAGPETEDIPNNPVDTTPATPPADDTPPSPPAADTTPATPPVDDTPPSPPAADTTPATPPADDTPASPPAVDTTPAAPPADETPDTPAPAPPCDDNPNEDVYTEEEAPEL